MSITLGIEGGGTRTRVLWSEDAGKPVLFDTPLSIKVVARDYRASAERLHAILNEALEGRVEQVSGLVLGLAGMSQERDREALSKAICEVLEPGAKVRVLSDAGLSLEAAFPKEAEGVLLIAGTGSVSFVKSDDGIFRYGGWGPAISDEGSGYWIGRKALEHYVHVVDGRTEEDALSHAVRSMLAPELRGNLSLVAQHLEREPRFPAVVARAVFESLAESHVADQIIRDAAICLSTLVKECLKHLHYDLEDQRATLYLSGSIACHPVIVEQLSALLFESMVELAQLAESAPARHALELAFLL